MADTPPLYALLVGINRYHPDSGIAPLRGAVNDARALGRVLVERYGIGDEQIISLFDEAATSTAFLDALDTHLIVRAQEWAAGPRTAETCPHFLVYFAGRGSLALEADKNVTRMVESLVLYNSRAEDESDLRPAALAGRMAALQEAGCGVTLMLDCGHSPDGPEVRACAPELRRRCDVSAAAGWDSLGAELFRAARRGEAAYERALGDLGGVVVRGAFSYALEQLLYALPAGLPSLSATFGAQVIDRTDAVAVGQTPALAGGDGLLLGGFALRKMPELSLSEDDTGQLWLNAGTARGLLAGCRLIVYPISASDESADASAADLAVVEVVNAHVDRSLCTLVEGSAPQTPALAAVMQPGTGRAHIYYAAEAMALFGDGETGPGGARLRAVSSVAGEAADLCVVADRSSFQVCSSSGDPLSGHYAAANVETLRVELAHRARFAAALVGRGGAAELPPGTVSIDIERLVFDEAGFPQAAPLEVSGGEPVLTTGMPVIVSVTNHGAQPLEFALFRFGPACEIACIWPTQGARTEPLQPGETRHIGRSARPIDQVHTLLPSDAVEARVTFRVYASLAPMATALLEQGPLGIAPEAIHAGASSAPVPPPSPWMTDDRGLRLLPTESALTLLCENGSAMARGNERALVETPPGFTAVLRWIGRTEAAQAEDWHWPPALAAHPQNFRSHSHAGGAGGQGFAGLAVDCDDSNRRLVCAESPLRLQVAPPAETALIAFAHDGRDYWPVGRCPAGGSWLDITWLPPAAPESAAEDDAAGAAALRRVLQIYLCEVRGAPAADLGLFAVRYVPGGWTAVTAHAHFVRPAPGGELRYTRATHVRPGERIALLIHGFADDSSEEAYWLTQLVRKPTAPAYDRILCFEWESLHTDVRESAQRLKDALAVLGLDEVPGVEIDLFAHSMGALVARAYVELLGGDGHVRSCFFTGPPNLGTPLAATALFTPWLLALALNLPAPTPPSLLISWAMGAVAWDMAGPRAMVPGSALLEELNGTRGTARLNYHVLAGNAWESAGGQGERWMSALSAGLNSSAHWFYEGDNDWVVGVRSCLTVPVVNYPGGVLLSAVVNARHTEYFRNEEVTAHVLTWLAALRTPDAPDEVPAPTDDGSEDPPVVGSLPDSESTPVRRKISFRKASSH